MELHSVVNINHWLSWLSTMTTQPLVVLISVAVTGCCLFLTLSYSRYYNSTAKNEDCKLILPTLKFEFILTLYKN
jgi:hypothetical protein